MKLFCSILLISVFAVSSFAQQSGDGLRADDPTKSQFSPFFHLDPFVPALKKPLADHLMCPEFFYFDQNASDFDYTESVTTSRWAVKFQAPTYSNPPAACTVWTVTYRFELLGTNIQSKDTIFVFIREATSPYNQIYSNYFLARPGVNQGSMEIDPPNVYPFVRPILNPKRDAYVGMYVKGDTSSHEVVWKFKTPSIFLSPPYSVRFVPGTGNNWTIQSASSVVGQSVDFPMVMKVCCNFPVPVELSIFRGAVQNDEVFLEWKTETEINNQSFEILRTDDLVKGEWESRGFVPGHGTTTRAQWYNYRDAIPMQAPPVLYYKLKQMDFDGTVQEIPPIRVYMDNGKDRKFGLLPSYPNPLVLANAGWTTIRYQLPVADHVFLAVYDALGREVAVLTNGQRSAGMHEIQWYPDASTLEVQTGCYFVRLKTNDRSTVQKIALVK